MEGKPSPRRHHARPGRLYSQKIQGSPPKEGSDTVGGDPRPPVRAPGGSVKTPRRAPLLWTKVAGTSPEETAARDVEGPTGLGWIRWAENLIEAGVEAGQTVIFTDGSVLDDGRAGVTSRTAPGSHSVGAWRRRIQKLRRLRGRYRTQWGVFFY